MHIILSRTDSIGDVVLTLPMAGLIKEKYPEAEISFIGRSYTRPVVKLSAHIDRFLNWDNYSGLSLKEQAGELSKLHADWIIHVFPSRQLAKAASIAGIPNRVGTSHRTFHWFTCNRRVAFSRRKSELHEAQLNCYLLAPLDIKVPGLKDIPKYYGFSVSNDLQEKVKGWIDPNRRNIVLHPKSKGSAREWGTDNFDHLIRLLPEDRFKLFVSGTGTEASLMKEFLDKNQSRVTNITGKFALEEFIAFLSLADAIVAASTGPLHLSASLGQLAIGIYPPIRPMHPGRWAPLGEKVKVLVKDMECDECSKSMDCHCIREIAPEDVVTIIMEL